MRASFTVKLFRRFRWAALLLLSTTVSAGSFSVESAHIVTIGNGHVLNAKIAYPLTARVKEAIDNGVPILFQQQLELIKSIPLLGSYWQWDETLWTSEIRHQLRYHALTQQYIVLDIDTQHQRNYSSLSDALNALGKINQLNLPPEYFTDPDNLTLLVRSGLDLNALPTPMRPGALISSKWQLTSPWVEAQWD